MISRITLAPTWSRELPAVPHHELAAVTVNGHTVIPIAEQTGGLSLYRPSQPEPVATLTGPPEEVQALCPFPADAGRVLVAAAREDGEVRVWDLVARTEVNAFATAPLDTACVVPTPQGHRLATPTWGRGGGSVLLWDVDSGEQVGVMARTTLLGATVMRTVRSYGRDLLVTANGDDDIVEVWDIAKDALWARLDGHTHAVADACAIPLSDDPLADQLLATSDCDHTLRTWDPTTGETITRIHMASFYGDPLFALRAGRRHLFGARDDQTLHFWDPRIGEEVGRSVLPYPVQEALQVGEHLLVLHPGGLASWRIQVEEAR